MMNFRYLFLAFVSPALLTAQASAASLLSSWNIITTGGLTSTSNTETEGTVRVGGDLTATSQYRVAIHTPVVDNGTNLIVGKNAYGDITIQHGNAAIGGDLNGTMSHPNGTYTTNDPSVQGIGAQDALALQGYAGAFAAMITNNSVTFPGDQPAGVNFTIGAVDSTTHAAVFDIAGSNLFNNSNIQQIGLGFANGLDQNSVSAVVINITGSGPLAWGSTGNFVGFFNSDWARTHVIWNFTDPDLHSLTFNNVSFSGSVLAPSADVVTDINSFQGSIFAKSLSQGGEVHQYLYQGYDPNITPAVPEPGSVVLLGISAALGLGFSLRRRSA
jgi:choice-of-anchor A domain-containing protein